MVWAEPTWDSLGAGKWQQSRRVLLRFSGLLPADGRGVGHQPAPGETPALNDGRLCCYCFAGGSGCLRVNEYVPCLCGYHLCPAVPRRYQRSLTFTKCCRWNHRTQSARTDAQSCEEQACLFGSLQGCGNHAVVKKKKKEPKMYKNMEHPFRK